MKGWKGIEMKSEKERYTGLRRHEKRIDNIEEKLITISTAILELDRITGDYVKFRNGLVDFAREESGTKKGKSAGSKRKESK